MVFFDRPRIGGKHRRLAETASRTNEAVVDRTAFV